MSDKIELTAEELQAKLEVSARINAELIEREKKALEELKVYKEAEAEAMAAAEKAKAEAEFELKVQERLAEELAKRDSLGTTTLIEEPAKDTGEEIVVVQEPVETDRERAIREAAERIK